MNYNRPDLLDRLASEYVLGTLRSGARRRFDKLLPSLPAARAAVSEWERRLASLAAPVPSLAPSAHIWRAVQARTTAKSTSASARDQVEAPWWSMILKPALGAVFALGVVQMVPGLLFDVDSLAQREQTLPQSYVGLLTDKDNQPTLLVSSTRHGTRVSVKFLRPVDVPTGKRIQVWALPKSGAPFPIGMVDATAPPKSMTFEMSASSEKLLSSVPRLAVSLEDRPAQVGSTPSVFVLSGFCVKLW